MKLTREHLKLLVRECLVEILSEGLGSGTLSIPTPARESRGAPRHSVPHVSGNKPRIPSSALMEAVKLEAGGNSVMADILADTAVTTLPKMLERGSTPVMTPQESFEGTPEATFGEASNRWANLAFMSPVSKKPA